MCLFKLKNFVIIIRYLLLASFLLSIQKMKKIYEYYLEHGKNRGNLRLRKSKNGDKAVKRYNNINYIRNSEKFR